MTHPSERTARGNASVQILTNWGPSMHTLALEPCGMPGPQSTSAFNHSNSGESWSSRRDNEKEDEEPEEDVTAEEEEEGVASTNDRR